jgi:hypothetical protein
MEKMIVFRLLWAAWFDSCAKTIQVQADFWRELAKGLGWTGERG